MTTGAMLNYPEFNMCEFNEGSPVSADRYVLYLKPDTLNIAVAEGDGLNIPPEVLYPGNDYLVTLISGSVTISSRFSTPPAIAYDGLGG